MKKLKKMIKKEKEKVDKQKNSEKISGSRSAQMMFKTALRNHIDLTNIADNKANILLTISTGVLTFGLPIATSFLESSPYLIMPTIILMLTCLLTIIFATLATRPIQMSGLSNPEALRQGKSNLFFFGNFYKMNINDYQYNLKTIISNDDYLENVIISDLFYLGKALGEKYAKLRVCYMIFMIGITATVIAYAISYYLHIQ
ncbi:MAG: Pycsar system effector family protein [Bacteroidota bacterium]